MLWLAAALALLVTPGRLVAESAGAGAAELFRLGVEALRSSRYADAASMFRLSYDMEQRIETLCTLAETYDRWNGHDQQALETFRRCAAEDSSGRFRTHAQERVVALGARLGQTPASGTPAPGPQLMNVSVTWQAITSTQGCFFFSGPGRLGRRDHLSDRAQLVNNGGRITMTFTGGQVFTGVLTGNQVALTRSTTYTYQGIWIVTETIQGAFAGNSLIAAYRYQECDARNPSSCPGRCTIQAQVMTH